MSTSNQKGQGVQYQSGASRNREVVVLGDSKSLMIDDSTSSSSDYVHKQPAKGDVDVNETLTSTSTASSSQHSRNTGSIHYQEEILTQIKHLPDILQDYMVEQIKSRAQQSGFVGSTSSDWETACSLYSIDVLDTTRADMLDAWNYLMNYDHRLPELAQRKVGDDWMISYIEYFYLRPSTTADTTAFGRNETGITSSQGISGVNNVDRKESFVLATSAAMLTQLASNFEAHLERNDIQTLANGENLTSSVPMARSTAREQAIRASLIATTQLSSTTDTSQAATSSMGQMDRDPQVQFSSSHVPNSSLDDVSGNSETSISGQSQAVETISISSDDDDSEYEGESEDYM
ncbi:hypothetical protein MMC25_007398 [Agyrium rufum]|nr:hypothetical protein [Agyrium rufum]